MNKPVFISYSSKDKEVAQAVCTALESEGVGAWMAPRDILPGRHYGESIVEAIAASKLMVLVFSSHSNASGQVLREVERAVSKGLAIVTFRIEDVFPTKSMEYFLSSQHWMDALAAPRDAQIHKLAEFADTLQTAQFSMERAAALMDMSGITVPNPRASRDGIVSSYLRQPTRRKMIALAAAASAVPVASGIWWLTRRATPAPSDALPAFDSNAIAVLPFRNLTGDKTIEYLGLSMPAELNAALARASSIVVRPLDTTRLQDDRSWLDVARALRARTVVAGKIVSVAPQLRLIVEINDAARNAEVWSDTLQGAASDTLNFVDQMVQQVGGALHVRLQDHPFDASLGTKNPQAYELFLRALTLGLDATDANNIAAIGLLHQAIALDGAFARAHAALAENCATRFWWNFSNEHSWLDQARTSARIAIALDPKLPEAHFALGFALEGLGRRGDALREYVASVRLGPRSVPALASLARYLFYMGEFERSIAALDLIAAVDPTYNIHVRKAMCFFFAGDNEQCRGETHNAESAARGVDQLTLTAFVYAWLGDFASAQRVLDRLRKEEPAALSILEIRAWMFALKGNSQGAEEQMKNILAQRSEFGIADEIATLYAILGNREQAISWLTRAVAAGAPNLTWYKSAFFKSVRGDPRYEAVVDRLSAEYNAVLPDIRSAMDHPT
jgi:TolB-like protein/Tfp pilus assembly protein PilF